MKSYTWRAAIIRSDLAPTTRHVLLTLSCHINDAGEPTYPSTLTLADECALSERAVVTHLKLAHSLGWLVVTKHGYGGQAWARNQYEPRVPDGFEPRPKSERKGTERRSAPLSGEIEALNDVQCLGEKGTEAGSVPCAQGLSTKALKHVQCLDEKGTEPRSVPSAKALNLTTEGTEPDDKKALNDVQSNYPIELPNNDDDARARHGAVDNSESSSSFSVSAMVDLLTRWEIDRGKSPRFIATQPQFAAWVDQGVTAAQLRTAHGLAVAARAAAGDNAAVNTGFLDAFVAKALASQRASRGAQTMSGTAWVETPEEVTAKAAAIGLPPQQPGEDRHWFRRRVLKAVGDTTLIEREVAAAERMNINEHERAHRYFYGCAPGFVAI